MHRFISILGHLLKRPNPLSGFKWEMGETILPDGNRGQNNDYYDCRIRRWFVQAASSPKDMIILLDNSGSMSGERGEIARETGENTPTRKLIRVSIRVLEAVYFRAIPPLPLPRFRSRFRLNVII